MSLREGYGLGTGTISGPLSQIHLKDTSSHLGGISGPNSTAIMTIFWQACGDRSGNYLNKLAPRMVWNGGLIGAILRSET